MLTLGDLFVYIKGDDSHLSKTLGESQKKVNQFAGSVGSSLSNALSFAAGGIIQQALNGITTGLQGMAVSGFQAVASHEMLTMSLESLIAKQFKAADSTIAMSDALDVAGPMAKDLLKWVQQLGIASPFDDKDIQKAIQLGAAYKFSIDQSKELTQALVDNAAASGQNADSINRAMLALGQINLEGKVTKENLNQLTDAGVDYVSALDKMGMSVADVTAGTVNSEQFVRALIETLNSATGGAAANATNTWSGLASSLESLARTGAIEFFGALLEPLRPLVEALSNAAASQGLRDSLRGLGELIASFLSPAIEWLTGAVNQLPDLFTRAATAVQAFRDTIAGVTVGDIFAALPGQLDQIQQNLNKTLEVMSQAHQGTIKKLEEQIGQAGERLGQKLSEINEKYANRIADLNERISETTEQFNQKQADLAEQHAKSRAKIEQDIVKQTADLEEKLTELKRDHEKRRRQLAMGLLTAETEEQWLSIKEQLNQEDEKYKEQTDKAKESNQEQVSELKARLTEEDAEYKKQQDRLAQDRARSLADLNKQLGRVQEEKAKEVAEVQKAYDQEVAALRDKITRENELYAKSVEEQKALADKATANALAAAEARAAALTDWQPTLQPLIDFFRQLTSGDWGGALAYIVTKINEFAAAINGFATNPQLVESIRTLGQQAGQALIDGIVGLLTGQGQQSLSTGLFSAITSAWIAINTLPITLGGYFVTGFIESVTSPANVEALKNGVGSALTQASEWWGTTLAEWAESIGVWWSETAAAWGKTLTDFDWSSIGSGIVDGIQTGMSEAWDGLTSWLEEQAASLPEFMQNPLKEHSPSRVFAKKVGEGIPAGVQAGAEAGWGDLQKYLGQAAASLIPAQPMGGALAGAGATNNAISLAPTFNLGQAPANFDAAGMMKQIDQRMVDLLMKYYKG